MAARVFEKQDFPPRFLELKKAIVDSGPESLTRLTEAWTEVLQELSKATEKIKEQGSDVSLACLALSRAFSAP
jgi:hypothetical protein